MTKFSFNFITPPAAASSEERHFHWFISIFEVAIATCACRDKTVVSSRF